MTRSRNGCCPFSLRICVSQRWFFLADSISHPSKNWNQIHSEIVLFLLVKNKMIQIGASWRAAGILFKWPVFQTGRVLSASKKIPDVMFAEMLNKQNRLSSLQVSRDTRASRPTQPLKTTITADSFAACLPCLNERELEQQFRNLNLEIRSWPEYFTNVVRPIDNVQPRSIF